MSELDDLAGRIETAYDFECEAGPLRLCADWQVLRQRVQELEGALRQAAQCYAEATKFDHSEWHDDEPETCQACTGRRALLASWDTALAQTPPAEESIGYSGNLMFIKKPPAEG